MFTVNQLQSSILLQRFWSKVRKEIEDESKEFGSCWKWMRFTGHAGHGTFWIVNGNYRAHVIAITLASGEEVNERDVLHVCDTPSCVRNDTVGIYTVGDVVVKRYGHLFYGTQSLNMLDRDLKKRTARGESGGNVSLTEKQVLEIRKLYKERVTGTQLAKMFNVHKTTIYRILNGEIWSHI